MPLFLIALAALGTVARHADVRSIRAMPHHVALDRGDDTRLSPACGASGPVGCVEQRRATVAAHGQREVAVVFRRLAGACAAAEEQRSSVRLRASSLRAGFLPPSLTYLRRNGQADGNGRDA